MSYANTPFPGSVQGRLFRAKQKIQNETPPPIDEVDNDDPLAMADAYLDDEEYYDEEYHQELQQHKQPPRSTQGHSRTEIRRRYQQQQRAQKNHAERQRAQQQDNRVEPPQQRRQAQRFAAQGRKQQQDRQRVVDNTREKMVGAYLNTPPPTKQYKDAGITNFHPQAGQRIMIPNPNYKPIPGAQKVLPPPTKTTTPPSLTEIKEAKGGLPIVFLELPSPKEGDKLGRIYSEMCIKDAIEIHGEAPVEFSLLYSNIPDASRYECYDAWITVADKIVVYFDMGVDPGMADNLNTVQSTGKRIEHRSLGSKWKVVREEFEALQVKEVAEKKAADERPSNLVSRKEYESIVEKCAELKTSVAAKIEELAQYEIDLCAKTNDCGKMRSEVHKFEQTTAILKTEVDMMKEREIVREQRYQQELEAAKRDTTQTRSTTTTQTQTQPQAEPQVVELIPDCKTESLPVPPEEIISEIVAVEESKVVGRKKKGSPGTMSTASLNKRRATLARKKREKKKEEEKKKEVNEIVEEVSVPLSINIETETEKDGETKTTTKKTRSSRRSVRSTKTDTPTATDKNTVEIDTES